MIVAIDIEKIWPQIEPKIRDIKERFGYDWQPEDVKQKCIEGKYFFYTTDTFSGFLVCKPVVDNDTGETALFIWIGWNGTLSEEEYMGYVNELAKGIGATKIELQSRRKGYERKGWKIKDITYTRKVEG